MRRLADLASALEEAQSREANLAALTRARRANLPLRYWSQQAHLTTPAGDEGLVIKALQDGTRSMGRILERFSVTCADLAQALDVDESRVVRLVENPRQAPLVMLDGEDSQALRPDVIDAGLVNAATLLASTYDPATSRNLRYFRLPGFNLGSTARDLLVFLDALAQRVGGSRLPLDGIVFPKIEHPEEIDVLYGHLDLAEREFGISQGSIQVGLLAESGWAVVNLPEIARRAAPRLSSLIFGLADFAADLRLDTIDNDHPTADWARGMIVAVAGAVGVPAIDGMTLQFPTSDPLLDQAANHERFLSSMRIVYDDARRAMTFGMTGKWVGHPAQLFAVLLAFDGRFTPGQLEAEAAKLESYRGTVELKGQGATMINGVMSDRATDRHARAVLRQAVALGLFPPERALALGAIDADELSGANARNSSIHSDGKANP